MLGSNMAIVDSIQDIKSSNAVAKSLEKPVWNDGGVGDGDEA